MVVMPILLADVLKWTPNNGNNENCHRNVKKFCINLPSNGWWLPHSIQSHCEVITRTSGVGKLFKWRMKKHTRLQCTICKAVLLELFNCWWMTFVKCLIWISFQIVFRHMYLGHNRRNNANIIGWLISFAISIEHLLFLFLYTLHEINAIPSVHDVLYTSNRKNVRMLWG